ncbi:MAG TPA: hypothetical protein VMG12_09600 [Polyangiaceae bacterium]|nr:hypothetical protein [Polyangiaceae bacterium]
MPLPNSGAGETLPGGPSGARTGAAAGGNALRQETLFGISPEQLSGKAAPQPAPAASKPATPPAASKPATPPAVAQTFFGVAPPGIYPERRKADAPPAANDAARIGGAPPTAAAGRLPPVGSAAAAGGAAPAANPAPAGTPLPADAALQNRTLLGVVPDDIAKAVAAARERAAAPVAPRADGTAAVAPRQPSPPGFEAVRVGGGTIVGGGASTPPRAAPAHTAFDAAAAPLAGRAAPAHTAFEAAAPPPAPRATPAHTAFEGPAPTPAGTVRSPSGAPRAPIPPNAESLDVEPDAELDPPRPGVPAGPIHAKTHLGVAIPGIAPLHAGVGQQPPPAAPRRPGPLEETQLQPDSLSAAPLSARAQLPRGAFVLLGSGLVLLIAAAAFALLWKSSKPLSVAISADASGKDRLDVVCQECPDGTLVSLDAARAEISGRKAYLTLPEPLPLGANKVRFGLQKPGSTEPEAVPITLPPVEYRIRPDTSTLVGDQPRLTLKVAAIPGSTVEIARQPIALDGSGNGEIAVDLAGELIGPASEVTTFEQSIGYRITPPSGKTYEGELAFKIGVTPLLLEAPGIDTVTDLERFMLAGRTTKGAELGVAGTTIPVDASGRFAQLMSIDSVGETRVTVRATEPGLAPRFVSFRLQRVQSLENEAAQRRPKALPLADVRRRIADHIGSSVIVSGRVEEARVDGHRTLLLLSPDAGCEGRSCLVRLVYGGLRKLARGEAITAIGRLQGAVAAPSGSAGEVPEIDVSLLL